MSKESSIKVYINGDKTKLPKIDGEYFCNRSGFKTVYEFKKGQSEMVWMKEVRWYMRPILNKEPDSITLAREYIKAANVLNGPIYAKEGGVFFLDVFLADFINFIKTYDEKNS